MCRRYGHSLEALIERVPLKQDDLGSVPPDDIPRSPTGRVPKWVIDESQGRISNPEPWRTFSSAQSESLRHHERKHRLKRFMLILVLLSIVSGSIWLKTGIALNPTVNGVVNSAPTVAAAVKGSLVLRQSNGPTPGYEESPHPLGTPAPLTVNSDSYQFIGYQSDKKTPVAYDPCRPIHFVIRTQGEPAGGNQIIMSAVSELSQTTGLQFIYDGTTSESPSFQRAAYQPERYGDRWVPVIFAWTTTAENPKFATNIDGESGSALVTRNNGPKIYVTGTVELDSVKLTNMLQLPDGNQLVRAVALHELGHLVGLGHVSDINQLMYPESGHGITDFGAGDLTGLVMLGRGTCAPNL